MIILNTKKRHKKGKNCIKRQTKNSPKGYTLHTSRCCIKHNTAHCTLHHAAHCTILATAHPSLSDSIHSQSPLSSLARRDTCVVPPAALWRQLVCPPYHTSARLGGKSTELLRGGSVPSIHLLRYLVFYRSLSKDERIFCCCI